MKCGGCTFRQVNAFSIYTHMYISDPYVQCHLMYTDAQGSDQIQCYEIRVHLLLLLVQLNHLSSTAWRSRFSVNFIIIINFLTNSWHISKETENYSCARINIVNSIQWNPMRESIHLHAAGPKHKQNAFLFSLQLFCDQQWTLYDAHLLCRSLWRLYARMQNDTAFSRFRLPDLRSRNFSVFFSVAIFIYDYSVRPKLQVNEILHMKRQHVSEYQ